MGVKQGGSPEGPSPLPLLPQHHSAVGNGTHCPQTPGKRSRTERALPETSGTSPASALQSPAAGGKRRGAGSAPARARGAVPSRLQAALRLRAVESGGRAGGCGAGGRAKVVHRVGRAVNAGLGGSVAKVSGRAGLVEPSVRGIFGNLVHTSVAAGRARPNNLAVSVPTLKPRHGALSTMNGGAGTGPGFRHSHSSPPQAAHHLHCRHCLLTQGKKLCPRNSPGEA